MSEVAVEPSAETVGKRLPVDTIPVQEWKQAFDQEPAGIFMERMWLEVSAGSGGDLGFIEGLVFFATPTQAGSALPSLELGWVFDPGGVGRAELVVNRAVNLLPYLREGLSITSEMDGRVPEDAVRFHGTAVLSVDLL